MELNNALDVFTAEMKAVDLWDNVTLIETSDFARTLNPNGGDGTDHAWGGNYFMMGKSFFVMSSQQENSFWMYLLNNTSLKPMILLKKVVL